MRTTDGEPELNLFSRCLARFYVLCPTTDREECRVHGCSYVIPIPAEGSVPRFQVLMGRRHHMAANHGAIGQDHLNILGFHRHRRHEFLAASPAGSVRKLLANLYCLAVGFENSMSRWGKLVGSFAQYISAGAVAYCQDRDHNQYNEMPLPPFREHRHTLIMPYVFRKAICNVLNAKPYHD